MYTHMFEKLVAEEGDHFEGMLRSCEELAAHQSGHANQSTSDIFELWQNSLRARPYYALLLERIKDRLDLSAKLAPPKHFWRILEKCELNAGSPNKVRDITRAMVVCRDFAQHKEVLDMLVGLAGEDNPEASRGCGIEFVRMKQRYAVPSSGGWRDIMVNFAFLDEKTRHICELQIVHEKMLLLRAGGGGHADYNKCRAAVEFLELCIGTDDAEEVVARIVRTQRADPFSPSEQLGDCYEELAQLRERNAQLEEHIQQLTVSEWL